MKTYSKQFKEDILRKILPPENRSLIDVAEETGVPKSTISTWLKNIKNGNLVEQREGPVGKKNSAEKLNLLIEFEKTEESLRGEWLRQHGLHTEHMTLFRQELGDTMTDKEKEYKEKIRALEKELSKKDKQLKKKDEIIVEQAALIVVKKKLEELYGCQNSGE